jgi:hypothetical protein
VPLLTAVRPVWQAFTEQRTVLYEWIGGGKGGADDEDDGLNLNINEDEGASHHPKADSRATIAEDDENDGQSYMHIINSGVAES